MSLLGTSVTTVRLGIAWNSTSELIGAILNHTVDYAGFVPLDSEGNVTKCAPHEAYKLIAVGKLTFDERIVLHRAGVTVFLHRAILK